MKLELKHLAPYLPFTLPIKVMEEEQVSRSEWEILEYNSILNSCFLMQNLKNIKPILRPILDLSILIIEEFEKYDGKRNGKANEEIINLFCEENGVDENIENMELKSLPYECVEFMFKNHYDFFGLIEKNLAIDINKIND
jgi:hypothetical protein